MSAVPPLLHVHELAGRRGPFEDDDVAAACEAVRGECGWHVAPVLVRDEVVVTGGQWETLILPTGRGVGRPLVDVHAVHDLHTDTEVNGWRLGLRWALIRPGGWPVGDDRLRVTLTHGYDACPQDLVSVVAERARALGAPSPPGVRSESESRTDGAVARTRARTYADARTDLAWSMAAQSVINRYRA